MKRALIITGLIVIAWSCVRYDDQAFFKYPVIHTTCVQSTVSALLRMPSYALVW